MASVTDKKAKMESLISSAAFVEGGIQEACGDACNICLEVFCESDPSAVSSHFVS
jgi:E3 ubiquitin-protein ligase RHF